MSMFFAPVLRTRSIAPAFRSFDPSFERFVNDHFFGNARTSARVEQDDKGYTLSLDVPGIAREDLEVAIEGTVVRVQTRKEATRQYKAAYELPQDIDVATSAAKLENGVLVLRLAQAVPANRVAKLAIN